MSPKRVQMTRRRPWRPENPDAVVVARPSRWGNPFKVGALYMTRSYWHPAPSPSVAAGRDEGEVYDSWGSEPQRVDRVRDRAHAVALFRAHVAYYDDVWTPERVAPLAGRDLACWCPLDQPCHADVLLELANGAES